MSRPTSLKEDARRVALLKALRDAVDAEYEQARRDVLDGLRAARTDVGLKSIRVSLPDDTPVAVITLTEPRASVVVTDETAFAAWVAENYPSEVETVVRVRPAWREGFLSRLEAAEPVADPDSGEVVPGVTARAAQEPRSFSLRALPGGREEIARAWRAGRVDLREVLALDAAESA